MKEADFKQWHHLQFSEKNKLSIMVDTCYRLRISDNKLNICVCVSVWDGVCVCVCGCVFG